MFLLGFPAVVTSAESCVLALAPQPPNDETRTQPAEKTDCYGLPAALTHNNKKQKPFNATIMKHRKVVSITGFNLQCLTHLSVLLSSVKQIMTVVHLSKK